MPSTAPAASAPADDTPTKRWAHTSGGTVSMERISPDGRRLIDVRLYVRDAKGLIQSRLTATEAQWDGKAWRLKNVNEFRYGDQRVERIRNNP